MSLLLDSNCVGIIGVYIISSCHGGFIYERHDISVLFPLHPEQQELKTLDLSVVEE